MELHIGVDLEPMLVLQLFIFVAQRRDVNRRGVWTPIGAITS
jgi:hypothetical protein